MRKLSIRERVLLALLAIIAVVSGYVLLFSMPISQRMEELDTRMTQAQELNAQLADKLTQQQQMQKTIDQLLAQEDAPPVMPEYDNQKAVMQQLHTILADCQEYSISFQGTQTEDNLYCRYASIPFTCSGYAQARDILQQLHDSDLRALLQDVQFSQQEDGTVRVSVGICFYEYSPKPVDKA